MFKKKWIMLLTAMLMSFVVLIGGCGTAEEKIEEENELVSDWQDTQAVLDENSLGMFTTQDIYGETVTQEIFQDYDLTLVNLFATWCSPCVAEMPELAQLQKNMADQGVNVVAVVLDAVDASGELDLKALALAQQLAAKSEAEFSFLVPDTTYFNGRLYGVQAVPESFFVDYEGKIVGETYVGARSLDEWTAIVELELASLSGEGA